jgi:hypothetical protein
MSLESVLLLSLHLQLYLTIVLVHSDWRLDFIIFQIFTVTTICHALFFLHDLTTLNVSAMNTNYEPPPSVGITTSILITLYLTNELPFQLNIFRI